ncbi:L-threonylcarbamoyladenylate synthase [Pontimonas sp.]|nr:L-threonylcarbamoyladenylate synthase [Pontimonas sp.]
MSAQLFKTAQSAELLQGMRHARMAIGRGQVVCVPTDTSYALVADAFKPSAVAALRAVRAMPERSPVSVFVPGIPTLRALAAEVADDVALLAGEFWPGALTLIVPAGESLAWDLGDTQGTVALRMPANRIALELLSETGPLAQSGAWAVGQQPLVAPAALVKRFGDGVSVVLAAADEKPGKAVSTVIDATSLDTPHGKLGIVREGAIPVQDIFAVVPPERFA